MIIIDLCVFNNAQWNDDDSGNDLFRTRFSKLYYPFGVDKYYVLLHRDDDDDIAEGGGSSQSARDFEPLFFFQRR